MGQEDKYLTRTSKHSRRSTKKGGQKSSGNSLLNVLIVVVALLIVISLVLIITNDDVKNEMKNQNPTEQEAASGTVDNSSQQLNNQSEQGDSSEQGNVNGHEEEQQSSEATENQAEIGEQSITYYESTDPIVTLAWIDAEWVPYATAQTGPHTSKFGEHIDYQEKLQLLYRDTGFTEETSIVWNVKNSNGDAIAVISSKDKQTIYRLSMQWVADTGWKTLLIEQLNSLEGAY